MFFDKTHHFKEEQFCIQLADILREGKLMRSKPTLYPEGHIQIFQENERL
jgi:hypothetical protein